MKDLNVAGLITAIKDEILTAERTASQEKKIFELNEMDLEIKFVVAKETSMNAELKVLSFGGGGTADYRNEDVQSIKLKFKVFQEIEDAPSPSPGGLTCGDFEPRPTRPEDITRKGIELDVKKNARGRSGGSGQLRRE
jgi:hypothetical protein